MLNTSLRNVKPVLGQDIFIEAGSDQNLEKAIIFYFHNEQISNAFSFL